MRRLDVLISNLATTPNQEDDLVDEIWSLVQARYPDADIAAMSGPDAEPAHDARPPHPSTQIGRLK